MMSTKQKWLLYVLYTFAVGIFFLYILFPTDVFKKVALFYVNRFSPDMTVAIHRVTPAFPIGLTAHALMVDFEKNILIKPDRVKITRKIKSLFRSNSTYLIEADMHQGKVDGTLTIHKEPSHRQSTLFNGTFEGIQFNEIPAVNRFIASVVSGRLNGNFSGKLDNGLLDKIDTEITLADLQVSHAQPLLEIKTFTFRRTEISLTVYPQRIHIKTWTFTGNQLDGSMSGNITFKKPIEESLLDLRGSISPHPEFLAAIQKTVPLRMFRKNRLGGNDIPFRMGGKINDPRFYLK